MNSRMPVSYIQTFDTYTQACHPWQRGHRITDAGQARRRVAGAVNTARVNTTCTRFARKLRLLLQTSLPDGGHVFWKTIRKSAPAAGYWRRAHSGRRQRKTIGTADAKLSTMAAANAPYLRPCIHTSFKRHSMHCIWCSQSACAGECFVGARTCRQLIRQRKCHT